MPHEEDFADDILSNAKSSRGNYRDCLAIFPVDLSSHWVMLRQLVLRVNKDSLVSPAEAEEPQEHRIARALRCERFEVSASFISRISDQTPPADCRKVVWVGPDHTPPAPILSSLAWKEPRDAKHDSIFSLICYELAARRDVRFLGCTYG